MVTLMMMIIHSRLLAAQSVMYRMAAVVKTPTFKDRLEKEALGVPRAPPTRQLPKPEAEAAKLKVQVKCSHKTDKEADAIKVYGAGRHGWYAKCTQCERRWKWNKETSAWDDPPANARASSAASSRPAPPLGAQAKSHASSRASGSRQVTPPVDPNTMDMEADASFELAGSEAEAAVYWSDDDL